MTKLNIELRDSWSAVLHARNGMKLREPSESVDLLSVAARPKAVQHGSELWASGLGLVRVGFGVWGLGDWG